MISEAAKAFAGVKVPVIDDEYKLVYEPYPESPNTWFVNDHTLIRDRDGRVHYFGIENPFPSTEEALKVVGDCLKEGDRPFIKTCHVLIHEHLYHRGTHYRVGHAVADDIWGPWERLAPALDGKATGYDYGSPFVFFRDDCYWMFVPESPPDDTIATGLFVSRDLDAWEKVTDATGWGDKNVFGPSGHRDPCIITLDDGTFLQYFAAADSLGRHTVNVASSKDLKHWKAEEPCYMQELPGAPETFGIFESPFVLKREGLYYLFIGFSHRHYYESLVGVSDNPYCFKREHIITTVFSHAPELIEIDGNTYISSCGIEDPQCLNRSGLWIARLEWLTP